MLREDTDELLTRTGPGTPMGELFRQYWIPALLAEELPENDCAPVRVKLLSERMIAFRDSEGRYGLIDEYCAHRGVSLWFGRNEEGGLRCPYHGWKYDVTGQCTEVPSEADNSGFCQNVMLTAYPLVRIGDVLWTYMGDRATQPDPPGFEWVHVPAEQSRTSKRRRQCNWLRACEGGIDSGHIEYSPNDTVPFFEVVDFEGGLFVGARRDAGEGTHHWRITPWVMPACTMVPPRGDHPVHGRWWVPIDDENCWEYSFDYHPVRALTETERQAMKDGHGVHGENIPGIAIQDSAPQGSMGPVVDRAEERLVPADGAVIKARQKLRKAAIALRDEGVTPPGVDPEHHMVRSAAVVLPQAESFLDSCREAIQAVPGAPRTTV